MVKNQSAFTLIEILVGIAVVGVLAIAAVPAISGLLDKQALKVKVIRLHTYVDKARSLAATTECPVEMEIRQAASAVNIQVSVQKDPFMKGCDAWFSQASGQGSQGFSALLDDVRLGGNVRFQFNSVSGVLDNASQSTLVLNYRKTQADINYLGIGKGVVEYKVTANDN